MNTPTAVSPDYPKWLYKAGARDVMVPNLEAETLERSRGYSHEQPKEEPAPDVTFGTPKPQPGTVPTAVMDAALEDLKAKFDRAWDVKCQELKDAQDNHEVLKRAHHQIAGDHDSLTEKHKKLNDDHHALAADHAKLLAEQNAAMEVAKPAKKG